MFQRRNWLVLHGKQYKRCGWKKCVIKKRTNILLVDDHDEVAMYHQQTNKHQQTIEQTEVIQEQVSSEVSQL